MKRAAVVLFVLGLTLMSFGARAQLTMYAGNGPSDNRIDFLILSEGYTAAEADQFQQDATYVAEAIFGESPFDEYRGLFNIGFGFVPSNQTGIDEWPTGNAVDSVLGCHFNCQSTQRLICCDSGSVYTEAGIVYPAYDEILVVVNSDVYGGSGGGFAVTSMAEGATDIPAHELGHSLGKLADEYSDPYSLVCDENYANITRITERGTLKWNAWVDQSTPLPTTSNTSDQVPVGAFQGGCYSATEYYRPVWNCKMRSLGRSFCPVCSEQLIRSFYNRVEPLDSWMPVEMAVSGARGDAPTFSVSKVALSQNTISVVWRLDGELLSDAAGNAVSLPISCLSEGLHTLTAVAIDDTPLVRVDLLGVLSQEVSWSVERTDDGPVETDCNVSVDTGGTDSDSEAIIDTNSAASTDSTAVDTAVVDSSNVDSSELDDTDTGSPELEKTSTDEGGCGCVSVGQDASENRSFFPVLLFLFLQ